MPIICPKCDSAYEIPAAAVTGRKRMRCARCLHEWEAGGTPPPITAATVAVSQTTPPHGTSPRVSPRVRVGVGARDRLMLVAAWAASVLILVGLGWGALHFRGKLELAWPASGRVYAWLGK